MPRRCMHSASSSFSLRSPLASNLPHGYNSHNLDDGGAALGPMTDSREGRCCRQRQEPADVAADV